MRLVNHSSVLVHKIYQRLGVEDVREYQHLVKIASALSLALGFTPGYRGRPEERHCLDNADYFFASTYGLLRLVLFLPSLNKQQNGLQTFL